MNTYLLEICAADIDSVYAAASGGADRVELCSALAEGGVTPSIGLISEAVKVPGIKVNVLIRPRGGDFIYTPREVQCMITDILQAREAGVNGVVIGALTADGRVDSATCSSLMEAAGDMPVTFHRAFDMCCDPREALDCIIRLGCRRILTSGLAPTALEGADMLRSLQATAGDRITLLAGSGVTPLNAREIMLRSGVRELHASARHCIKSPSAYRKPDVNMGQHGVDEYSRMTTSASIVRQLADTVHHFHP